MSFLNANILNCNSLRIEDASTLLTVQKPLVYSVGTASVSGGTATGTGTTWVATMVGGFLNIAGMRYAITGFTSATSLTVSSGGDTITPAVSYFIDYTPQELTFDVTGSTANTTTTLAISSTVDRTITFPDEDDTLVTLAATQTLTNKTLTSPLLTTPQINDTSMDHQYILGVSELAANRTVTLPLLGADDEFTFNAATQTLTNKTLTSPLLTTPQINDTSMDHQYILGVSELAADRTVTLPLLGDDDEFTFNAATQTLSNKTLTLPQINDTSMDNQYVFAVSELTANRTVTLPLLGADDEFTFNAATQTLTNKTLTLPQINDTSMDNQYVFAVSELTANRTVTLPLLGADDEFTFNAATQTLTNKTLTSPLLTTPQINDTSMDHQYILGVSELAADRTVTLPLLGADDEFTFNAATQTLTNKTLTSPLLTTPQINDTSMDHQYVFAVSELTANRTVTLPLLGADDEFTFNSATQTLTNKTLSTGTNFSVDPIEIGIGTSGLSLTGGIAIGSNANAIDSTAVSLGTNAKSLPNSIAIGKNALNSTNLTYSVGTASISGTTATGIGTTWISDMRFGYITIAGVSYAITFVSSPTSMSVSPGATVSAQSYVINYVAGAFTTLPTFNVAIGENTLSMAVESYNSVVIGHNTGSDLTTGYENVIIGKDAASSNSNGAALDTGYQNVIIGNQASVNTNSNFNAVAIGYQAVAEENSVTVGGSSSTGAINSVVFGSSSFAFGSGSVCIGTSTSLFGTDTVVMGHSARGGSSASSVFIGKEAGNSSSSGDSNVGIGFEALNALTSGINNTTLGYRAGNTITTAGNNVLIGFDADVTSTAVANTVSIGSGSSAADSCVVIGQGATSNQVNTLVLGKGASVTGANGLAIGLNAKTGAGTNNSAIGSNSLTNMLFGTNSTAFGFSALNATTYGVENTAIGSNALLLTATATYAIGTAAVAGGVATGTGTTWTLSMVGGFLDISGSLYEITSFTSATSLGVNSGVAVIADQAYTIYYDGSFNTALGYNAGSILTTGSSNTLIGRNANVSIATDSNAVAIGSNAVTATDSIVIGQGATTNQVNSLVMGKNASVTGLNGLAIGLNASTGTGSNNSAIGNNALANIGTGANNTAVGYNSLNTLSGSSLSNTAVGYNSLSNIVGTANTAIGVGAGNTVTTGSENTFVGTSSDSIATATGVTALGVSASANNDYAIAIGYNPTAGGEGSIAIGGDLLDSAFANSDFSISIGSTSFVFNNGSVALGYKAGVKSSFGVAIGEEAHTSGINCVFIGRNSGNPAETRLVRAAWGDSCTAVGSRTLNAITGGAENTALGASVLNASTSLTYAVGTASMDAAGLVTGVGTTFTAAMVGGYIVFGNTGYRILTFGGATSLTAENPGAVVEPGPAYTIYYDAIRNTGLGAFALSTLTSASNNTAIGYNAGLTLTTGSENVLIGRGADVVAATDSDSVIIGDSATAVGSSVVIGSGASSPFPGCIVIGKGAVPTAPAQLVLGSPGFPVTTISNIPPADLTAPTVTFAAAGLAAGTGKWTVVLNGATYIVPIVLP